MKISDIFATGKPTLSFEVFPPKTSDKYEVVEKAVREIAALKPDFMSVTYGAGGGTSAYTASIAADIKNKYGVNSLAHLTCVSSDREMVKSQLALYKECGIENILALRGDIPAGMERREEWTYHYACELIPEIKEAGDFCIGGACYPEVHPDSPNQKEDIRFLKQKVDAGLDFLTTQMFFDNNVFYNYLYKVREAGVTVPVVSGIMPVTNAGSIKRSVKLSGAWMPQRFRAIIDRFGDDPAAMKQAGIAYATDQIIDLLANGVNHIHVYAMNKPDVVAVIQNNLSDIFPSIKANKQ